MFDRIEKGLYWDRLWRLVDGRTPCSPGCEHCWSGRYTHRFDGYHHHIGSYTVENRFTDGNKFSGNIELRHDNLDLPLRTRKPQSWLILNDLFHEQINDNFVRSAWENMVMSPRHIFLVLTKRPKGMAEFFKHRIIPENVWPMITICNQEEADRDIPFLLQINAPMRGISIEPMLGPININMALARGIGSIQWVVLGGESGPGARPMYPDWVRSVRNQCLVLEMPFFFKQWGRTPYPPNSDISDYMQAGFDPYSKSKNGGRELDGRKWNELPEVKG